MTVTRESVRIEKVSVAIKAKMLDFPVLSWSGVKCLFFPRYSETEIQQALDHLRDEGFITIVEGSRGGVRYVRMTKE